VIIATYRRPESLGRCVEALRLQTLRPLEVIVVARQTDDETRSLLEAQLAEPIPSCVVLVDEPGMVAALNRGLSVAQGDVVAFTDDDTEPHVTWLERIVSRFFDGEGRAEQTLAACADGEHNDLYVLLKRVPWWQKPLVTAYALLVGTRAAPGVLLLVEQLLVASNKRAVLHRSRAALRGRLSGVLTFLESRGSAEPT
jgi:glycosyltransferase involved in cell wall biosynthesis